MPKKNIPFNFVFDHLLPLDVTVKPMFGMWAIYLSEKILLILRQRSDQPDKNGVWVATNAEHHKSLKSELPSLRSIFAYEGSDKDTEWQLLPVSTYDFEASVGKVCELIKSGDDRIGKIPKSRKRKGKN
jgi:hypothetical protein